jgi:hypothetical protein
MPFILISIPYINHLFNSNSRTTGLRTMRLAVTHEEA